ncbi:branched-chain amino acid ABC transporter permease [Candidatus Woesearchaeota archaeon]|nr:branched-chain amino acid ABC transporter permease [Candidatus Woesearchaeota archaeon]
MSLLLQLLLNGLIAGSIYSLVSSGFSLIYQVNKFMNFAHGSVLALSAYLFYSLSSMTEFALFFLPIIPIISGFIGLGLNRSIYRSLRKGKSTSGVLLIASIALMILLNALIQSIWGAAVRIIQVKNPIFEILSLRITLVQICIIVFSISIFFILYFLMKKTKLGKAMRAVSDNKEVAQTIGINSEKIYDYIFFICSAIVGAGGVLIGIEQNLSPQMGIALVIKGFTGAVIGGLSSIQGAIAGSFILGILENLGILWLPSGYKDAISFIILFLFLLIKPSGLFGKKMREA